MPVNYRGWGHAYACAIGLVRVDAGLVVRRALRLIRPHTCDFNLTGLHGITRERVADAPGFATAWPALAPFLAGAAFVAAHNAAFDGAVLRACCARGGISLPGIPFLCTVRLVREVLQLPRARLPLVCERLGIPLAHHDAGSDAVACACIVLEAARAGWRWSEDQAVHL